MKITTGPITFIYNFFFSLSFNQPLSHVAESADALFDVFIFLQTRQNNNNNDTETNKQQKKYNSICDCDKNVN